MKNLKLMSLFLASFIFFNLIFAEIANAQQVTPTTPAQQEDMKKYSSQLDEMAKKIAKHTLGKTIEILQSQGGALTSLLAFLIFLEFVAFVKATKVDGGVSNLKELFELCFAVAIVGSCVSPKIYHGTGLSNVFKPSIGQSGELLSIDFLFKVKEVSEEITNGIFGNGEEVRKKFEQSRSDLAVAVFTGEINAEEPAEEVSCGVTPECYINKYFTMKAFLNFLFFAVDLLLLAGLVLFAILFSITASLSLLMFTFIAPFGVMKAYRGRIWSAYKVPLSSALFGSVGIFINACGFLAFSGLAMAITELDTTVRVALAPIFLLVLLFLNLCLLGALPLIPKISRQLLNLSLEELVTFSQEAAKNAWGAGMMVLSALPAAGAFVNAAQGISKNAAANSARAAAGAAAANAMQGGGGPSGGPGGGFPGGGGSPGGSSSGSGTASGLGQAMASGLTSGMSKASIDKGAQIASKPAKSVLAKNNKSIPNPMGESGTEDGPEGLLNFAPPPNLSGNSQSEMFGGSTKAGTQGSFDINDNIEENKRTNKKYEKEIKKEKQAQGPVQPDPVSNGESKQLTLEESAKERESLLFKNRVKAGFSKAVESTAPARDKFNQVKSGIAQKLDNTAAGRVTKATAGLAKTAAVKSADLAKKGTLGVAAGALKVGKLATSRGTYDAIKAVGYGVGEFMMSKGDVVSAGKVAMGKLSDYRQGYESKKYDGRANLIDGTIKKLTGQKMIARKDEKTVEKENIAQNEVRKYEE